jgi:hypothetical protein
MAGLCVKRLHRTHALVSGVAIVAIVAVLVPTGIANANSYHQALSNCSVSHIGCGDIGGTVFAGDAVLMGLVQTVAVAVPLVLGILWGAPLVASEFEADTQDFAWTQGVSRRRWMLTNIGWALLAAAAWGGALAALFTWWRGPANAVFSPLGLVSFDVQGVVPVAYAVFAMAFGIAAGALFRRVVPAITTTLGVVVAVRVVVVLFVRRHVPPGVSEIVSLYATIPANAWKLSEQIVSPTGTVLAGPPAACPAIGRSQSDLSCLVSHGYHRIITYLPASRFWPAQGIESGIFLVLALGLVVFTLWWSTTRDA